MNLSVGDRLDLLDVYARYAHLIDAADDEWCDCFVPDGALVIPAHGFTAEGHDQLRRFARNYHRMSGGRDRHVMSNVVLAGHDVGATGSSYLTVITGGSGSYIPRLKTTGTYRDLLRRTADGWKFVRRELTIDEGSDESTKQASPPPNGVRRDGTTDAA